MTETVAPPLKVSDASRSQVETLARVWMHQSSYARLRHRLDITATTRARADWGLAVLEFIEASVVLAAAKDHRSPLWAAATARERMFTLATPERANCEQAWREYQAVRRTESFTAIEAARAAWRAEFVGWFQVVASRGAIEDEQAFRDLRGQLDDSDRLGTDLDDTQSSRTAELVHAARERDRRESIRQEQMRDRAGLNGWRPSGW